MYFLCLFENSAFIMQYIVHITKKSSPFQHNSTVVLSRFSLEFALVQWYPCTSIQHPAGSISSWWICLQYVQIQTFISSFGFYLILPSLRLVLPFAFQHTNTPNDDDTAATKVPELSPPCLPSHCHKESSSAQFTVPTWSTELTDSASPSVTYSGLWSCCH